MQSYRAGRDAERKFVWFYNFYEYFLLVTQRSGLRYSATASRGGAQCGARARRRAWGGRRLWSTGARGRWGPARARGREPTGGGRRRAATGSGGGCELGKVAGRAPSAVGGIGVGISWLLNLGSLFWFPQNQLCEEVSIVFSAKRVSPPWATIGFLDKEEHLTRWEKKGYVTLEEGTADPCYRKFLNSGGRWGAAALCLALPWSFPPSYHARMRVRGGTGRGGCK